MLKRAHFQGLGAAASVTLHVAVFFALTGVPRRPPVVQLDSLVEFEVPAPEPMAPLEPARPELNDPPEPVRLTAASNLTPPPQSPEPAAPPRIEELASDPPAAVDLTGLTLTNDTGSSGWASRVGNGSVMRGPLRARPGPALAPKPVTTGKPQSTMPRLVALANLSERPKAPALDHVLERHYPTVARQQGKSGNSVVRLRIDADGQVRHVTLVSESEAGFGAACRATVMGSHWTPPRDASGNRVATLVSYTCRFNANR